MADVSSLYPQPTQSPFARMSIGDLISAASGMTGLQQAKTNLSLGQQAAINNYVGSLADSVKDKKELQNFLLIHARNNPTIPWGMYQRALDSVPDSGPDFQRAMKQYVTIANPTLTAGAETGTPNQATGAPTMQSSAAGVFRRGGMQPPSAEGTTPSAAGPATVGPGGQVVGMPTGFEKSASAGIEAVQGLHNAADTVPAQQAMLDNMLALSDPAATGPTAEIEKKANQLWQRFVPNSGITLSAKQLRATEEFDKIAEQVAGAQASAAHATDAYLRNAYGANPNIQMSKLGRTGVIHMLSGNLDAISQQRNEWMAYKNGQIDGRPHADNEYRDWVYKFNNGIDPVTNKRDPSARFDPRVFQFARMSPQERQDYLGLLKEKPGGEFEQHLNYAIKRGWITP